MTLAKARYEESDKRAYSQASKQRRSNIKGRNPETNLPRRRRKLFKNDID